MMFSSRFWGVGKTAMRLKLNTTQSSSFSLWRASVKAVCSVGASIAILDDFFFGFGADCGNVDIRAFLSSGEAHPPAQTTKAFHRVNGGLFSAFRGGGWGKSS